MTLLSRIHCLITEHTPETDYSRLGDKYNKPHDPVRCTKCNIALGEPRYELQAKRWAENHAWLNLTPIHEIVDKSGKVLRPGDEFVSVEEGAFPGLLRTDTQTIQFLYEDQDGSKYIKTNANWSSGELMKEEEIVGIPNKGYRGSKFVTPEALGIDS